MIVARRQSSPSLPRPLPVAGASAGPSPDTLRRLAVLLDLLTRPGDALVCGRTEMDQLAEIARVAGRAAAQAQELMIARRDAGASKQ